MQLDVNTNEFRRICLDLRWNQDRGVKKLANVHINILIYMKLFVMEVEICRNPWFHLYVDTFRSECPFGAGPCPNIRKYSKFINNEKYRCFVRVFILGLYARISLFPQSAIFPTSELSNDQFTVTRDCQRRHSRSPHWELIEWELSMGRKFYNQEPSKKVSFEMIWCMCGHFRLSAQKEQLLLHFFYSSFFYYIPPYPANCELL